MSFLFKKTKQPKIKTFLPRKSKQQLDERHSWGGHIIVEVNKEDGTLVMKNRAVLQYTRCKEADDAEQKVKSTCLGLKRDSSRYIVLVME